MARINVEEAWYHDPRRQLLANQVGSADLADGVALRFWRLSQDFEDGLIPADIFDVAEHAKEFEAAKLAERRGELVYIKGGLDHHLWIQERREAGRKGGLSKSPDKLKNLIQFRSTPEACASELSKQTEASSSSSSSLSEEKKEHTPLPPQGGMTAFDRFWTIYPKKVGKKAAKRAWDRSKINGSIDRILRAVEQQKTCDQWTLEGGRFIPNPATWINQGRWDDEPGERPIESWEKRFLRGEA